MTKTRVVKNTSVAPTTAELATQRLTAAPQPFSRPAAPDATLSAVQEEMEALSAPAVAEVPAPVPVVAEAAPAAPKPKLTMAELTQRVMQKKIVSAAPVSVVPISLPAAEPEVAAPQKLTMTGLAQLALQKKMTAYSSQEKAEVTADRYKLEAAPAFIPPTRKGFGKFLEAMYLETFQLPPILQVDRQGCKKLMQAAATNKIDTFLYQEFVREYLRAASPYRGLLVYHGLGSGKTCSAIAAAEALYGSAAKEIIIMTPGSLRGNFQSQIAFCGFRHFRTDNYWTKLSAANPLVLNFARTTLMLPNKFLEGVTRREDPATRVIYVPDFSKESNYSSFSSQEQSYIRAQIVASLESRIKFINYNGISAAALKAYACETGPTRTFDNKVIIIDEVHNLTRLMSGKVERYAGAVTIKRRAENLPYEPVTAGRWQPTLCKAGKDHLNYTRAYLFYRLLTDARNSKIIALSGTPLINTPDEIGILMNLVAGYIECVEGYMLSTKEQDKATLKELVRVHPRLDSIFFTAGQGSTGFRISAFPEGYIKVLEPGAGGAGAPGAAGAFKGIRADLAAQQGIQAAWDEVAAEPAARALKFSNIAYTSYPRFPIEKEKFTNTFLQVDAAKVKNQVTILKRMHGLVSYYRGATEGLMPDIVEDVVVSVPLRGYALRYYTQKRTTEISEEVSSSTGGKDDDYMDEKNPTSYRFNSRAACNFAFPESIERPFRRRDEKSQIEFADQPVGDVIAEATTEVEDMEAEMREREAVEADEAAIAEGAEDEIAAAAEGQVGGADADADTDADADGNPPQDMRPYAMRLQDALAKIRSSASQLFALQGEAPNRLDYYSPKYAAMIEKINASPGSALVYSQFKSAEGLGIFGFALEANGYTLLDFVGSDRTLAFSPAAEASLRRGPAAGERRFMFFTGDGSLDTRKTILNIFNANFNQLPPNIKRVLEESGYTDNQRGQLCKVFGITSSGAEGISLKCVRSVHIMEPYWNKVRTEQVKGRAIRICSHADLADEADRNVSIYTYCCVFSPEDRIDETLKRRDKSQTSDAVVLELGNKKEAINEDFLNVLKTAAVDCGQNFQQNKMYGCYEGVQGSPEEPAFNPSVDADLDVSEQQRSVYIGGPAAAAVAAPGAEPVEGPILGIAPLPGTRPPVQGTAAARAPATQERTVISLGGRQYWLNPDRTSPTETAYTLYDLSDIKARKPLGRIVKNPATGKYKKPTLLPGL